MLFSLSDTLVITDAATVLKKKIQINNNNMKKNWKTSLMGVIGILFILIALALVYFGKATLSEVATFGGSMGLILTTILGFLSKDYNVSGGSKNISDNNNSINT